ncbi:hypothetical protein HPB52_011541 [Rhipicephalus sanguineus]|uniref:Uncharacterized protein n=1 Tax=Rhipicephalus sanguineus TaxID=34632 RepID=A0A9D4T5I3_RHISA|nr:hypothetical protein HPB52_011541 [Rhipicephalus sanguineus]
MDTNTASRQADHVTGGAKQSFHQNDAKSKYVVNDSATVVKPNVPTRCIPNVMMTVNRWRDKVQIPCTLNFINQCTEGLSRAAALVAVKALEENIEAVCNVDSDPYKGKCELTLQPGCKVETLRACGDDYIPYKNDPHLHESGQEFEEGCKKDKVQIPCTLKFINDCTIGLSKAAALVAVKALEENIEAACSVGSEAYNNYQKIIKCMNSQGAKLHKCMNDFQGILERAVVKAPTKDIIHYTCWVGAQDYMVKIAEDMFGETLNLVCGRYKKGSAECKSLPPLPRLGAKDRRLNNVVEILLEAAGTLGRKN